MSADTTPEHGSTAPSRTGPTSGIRRHRWLLGPAALLLLVILVRTFLVTPFGIPSGSMQDTLLVGDRILVSKLTAPADLRRGDIVVFDASQAFNLRVPERGLLQTFVEAAESILGKGQPTDYVKRVIGLPGDHVRCCAPDGRLEINGVPVDEPYVAPGSVPSAMTFDVTVPPDRFWVMGDNRDASADSRAHLGDPGGGMVPGEDIIGKVWVRYWPLGRLGDVGQGQLASVPAASVPRNGE